MIKTMVRFASARDPRTMRVAVFAVGLLAAIVGVVLLSRGLIDEGARQSAQAWLEGLRQSPLALPAVMAMFVAGAFLAVPQTVLFGVTVLAFGFSQGIAFVWISTLTSATVTFLTGRKAGAGALDRYGGGAGRRITEFAGSNGFTASFLIRLVPSAPFIVVNMALGAAGVRLGSFLAGTALGVLPKALIVGAIAGGVLEVSEGGDWRIAAALAGFAVFWIGVLFIARKRLNPKNSSNPQ